MSRINLRAEQGKPCFRSVLLLYFSIFSETRDFLTTGATSCGKAFLGWKFMGFKLSTSFPLIKPFFIFVKLSRGWSISLCPWIWPGSILTETPWKDLEKHFPLKHREGPFIFLLGHVVILPGSYMCLAHPLQTQTI